MAGGRLMPNANVAGRGVEGLQRIRAEVLATIADVVLPRMFEQLREYGLGDLVP